MSSADLRRIGRETTMGRGVARVDHRFQDVAIAGADRVRLEHGLQLVGKAASRIADLQRAGPVKQRPGTRRRQDHQACVAR